MPVINIVVTNDDIEAGNCLTGSDLSTSCVLFHTLRRYFPNLISVGTKRFLLNNKKIPGGVEFVPLPHNAQNFIARADVISYVGRKGIKPDKNDVYQSALQPMEFSVQVQ